MYLLQIDPVTQHIKEDPENDGWMAIPSFVEVYKKPKYGIKALTVIALVVDYGSIIKHYPENERISKAIDIVYEDRKAIVWNSPEMQLAAINYREMQRNPILEERKILDDMRNGKLQEIEKEPLISRKQMLLADLKKINELIKDFEKENASKDLFMESPVRNGYNLRRLEIKVTDKKSFYHERSERRKERQLKIKERKSADNAES